jgi:CRP-like cAMP-binding protein
MITLLEKMLVLKSVALFAGTPDEVLVAIAGLLGEEEYRAGQNIFAKGDQGSSMYIIVRGLVAVRDGPRTLNELGERAVFGEMTMLDPEPRVATVTALEDTLLLRLDHGPFYELLADRAEVAEGIIRLLAGYVRARVDDMSRLDGAMRRAIT